MNISLSVTRNLLLAACAALVTVGCGGGGGSDPTAPSATGNTSGGNGDTGTGTGAGTGTGTTGGDAGNNPTTPTAAPHAQHKRCGWIGADTFDAGKKSFLANPDYFDAIHPKWGSVLADGSIRVLPMADDAEIMATAKQHQIKVIPLIDADDVSFLRNVMAS